MEGFCIRLEEQLPLARPLLFGSLTPVAFRLSHLYLSSLQTFVVCGFGIIGLKSLCYLGKE